VLIAFARTLLLYLILIAVIRLMGKRQLGQMEPAEFVVTMLVANLAAIPMQDGGIPLLSGLVPILTVLGSGLILSWLSLRCIRVRRLLCGKPVILIENGRILQNNLRRTGITMDELTGHLREKDVLNIRQVQFAILETDGGFSVFPYPKYQPASAKDAGIEAKPQHLPITIIEDGHLFRENLTLSGKDDSWLARVLQQQDAVISSTWLLTVDKADQVNFVAKEGRV
jgi:uncharacterized membrane protein YcaP (DUF421 family)